jgi:hypothetical protein
LQSLISTIEAQEVATNLHQQDFAFDLYDPPLPFPIRPRWMESDSPLKEGLLFLCVVWRVKRHYFSTAI